MQKPENISLEQMKALKTRKQILNRVEVGDYVYNFSFGLHRSGNSLSGVPIGTPGRFIGEGPSRHGLVEFEVKEVKGETRTVVINMDEVIPAQHLDFYNPDSTKKVVVEDIPLFGVKRGKRCLRRKGTYQLCQDLYMVKDDGKLLL